MTNIFIFNPETDFALASGNHHYNPPANIIKLRKDLQLIQAEIAAEGDIIIVSDDFSRDSYPNPSHLRLLEEKNIGCLTLAELSSLISHASTRHLKIMPWGWNHSLRKTLQDAGLPQNILKTESEIDNLRALAHRSTTITFLRYFDSNLPLTNIDLPKEFCTPDEALEFARKSRDCFFKAPWSSSGRGIVKVKSDSLSPKTFTPENPKLKEWLTGTIRRQGSVIGEIAYDRIMDCASEWWVENGEATFKGLSLFHTSEEGRYTANEILSQDEIENRINQLSSTPISTIIGAQQLTLKSIVAPTYNGPIGIDMLIDSKGNINPCVEINMRFTMGMIALGDRFLKD